MAKINQVTIINQNILRLDVDAKKGDEINLMDIVEVDSSYINKLIDDAKEKELNRRISELKEKLDLEATNKINIATENLKKENVELNSKLESIRKEVEANIKLLYIEQINDLKNKILTIENNNKLLEQEKNNIATQITLKQNIETERRLSELKEQHSEALRKKDQETIDLKDDYVEKLRAAEQQINDLRLAKSNLNVKKIGEELENWCNAEYENYAQCGFENCTWEKDNTSIKEEDEAKGTKADYIFKVYASSSLDQKELLTSVACEMKNESPNSKTKKKNSDHYNKLDKDRKKKNCEYALLISELEWDQPNDVPIKKVNEYEKMYVVRPQYFITFLSIVTSMGKKFQEYVLNEIKEQEKFKDVITIKEEFEKFKSDLLDKPLAKLEKELNAMIDEANKIKVCSDKIITSASSLINKTIKDIESKVVNFKIDRLVKKINKLEE